MVWSSKEMLRIANDANIKQPYFKIILVHSGYNFYTPGVLQPCGEVSKNLSTLQDNLDDSV